MIFSAFCDTSASSSVFFTLLLPARLFKLPNLRNQRIRNATFSNASDSPDCVTCAVSIYSEKYCISISLNINVVTMRYMWMDYSTVTCPLRDSAPFLWVLLGAISPRRWLSLMENFCYVIMSLDIVFSHLIGLERIGLKVTAWMIELCFWVL